MPHGLNFPLTTTAGELDLLGTVSGGGGYEALKRAAGRPKDFEAIAELERLTEED